MQMLKMLVGMFVGVVAYFTVQFFLFSDRCCAPMTPDEVAAALASTPMAEFFELVKTRAPDEFDELMEDYAALSRRSELDEDAITRTSADITAAIRKRHAEDARNAPQESLIAVVRSQRDLLLPFKDDPETCNAIIMRGPGAIDLDRAEELLPLLAAGAMANFTAIYDGRDSKRRQAPPTDRDYQAFFDSWQRRGVSERMLAAIERPDEGNPDLCGAFLSLFEQLAIPGLPGVGRVRAEVVVGILGS